MDIGIGLPATIPGARGDNILEWARCADAGPFSSLSIIDRLVFPNYEPMVTLAAAAAVTRRIRLTTTVLLVPARNAAVLAKEAATIDSLSNGRLTLGVGVGAREDDFVFTGQDFHQRGRLMDEALELMHRMWAGQDVSGVGPVGPQPVQEGGPPLLIGGYGPAAVNRLARWGQGFISGGAPAEMAQGLYRQAERVWKEAGRPGTPRLVGSLYYVWGEENRERGGQYLRTYYGDMGAQIAQIMPSSARTIKERVKSFEDVGADEVFIWPTTPDLEQVDRLAEELG